MGALPCEPSEKPHSLRLQGPSSSWPCVLSEYNMAGISFGNHTLGLELSVDKTVVAVASAQFVRAHAAQSNRSSVWPLECAATPHNDSPPQKSYRSRVPLHMHFPGVLSLLSVFVLQPLVLLIWENRCLRPCMCRAGETSRLTWFCLASVPWWRFAPQSCVHCKQPIYIVHHLVLDLCSPLFDLCCLLLDV